MQRMAGRLVESLDLDDQQRQEFDDIIAGYEERQAEQGQIGREMREAQQDGDEQRAAELRAELGELGRRRGNPMTQILDEIKPILREDQMEAFNQLRERMGRNQRQGGRGQDRGIENLIEELDLTEQQQQDWEQIRGEQRERGRTNWEEIRPLIEEMRQARDDGDEERLAEIRAKFEEMRGGRGGNNAQLDALEEILDDDQRKILTEYRERASRRGGRDDRNRAPDVRGIIQAAKRLDLDNNQKEDLRDIEQSAGRLQREVRRDREAAAKLAEQVKRDIMDILDDDQKRDLERQLDRGNRRGGRRGESRGDGRDDRGRRDRRDRPRRGSDDP